MFSLIITIVSIALVAALAVATIYYGGDAFNRNGQKAAVAKVMTTGSQISGAVEAYKAQKGTAPASIDELVTANFLSAVPAGSWTFANNYIVASSVNEEQCAEANRQLGIKDANGNGLVPGCGDASVNGITACCST